MLTPHPAYSWLFRSALRRVLLTLAVVFGVLATSGWVTRSEPPEPGSYAAQRDAWASATLGRHRLPRLDAGPEEVARFFAGIPPHQRQLLAERYPLVVGNLPGAPVTLRYTANRHALAEARNRQRGRARDERLSASGAREAGRLLHRFESLRQDGRQILAFDPTGGGRAAEVYGDLERATHVSIVVPGVDTDLLNFERTQLKYRAPAGMAEALHAAQRKAAPEVETAVIAWADYTAPAGFGVSAATGRLAAEGAERLVATVRGLPRDADVSLFCHSYGSVVCGLAAAELPPQVTDIAVAGSPGMRADDVSGLGTTARIWAARAEDDWIADVPHFSLGPLGHGSDPFGAAFGALRVPAERVPGHTGYFHPGTDSLRVFALIGSGRTTAAAPCTAKTVSATAA